jgi:predicted nucleotidyltransferase
MVVGAVCRDVLHAALGMSEQLTATGDLDLAFGVKGWEQYRALTTRLESVAGSGSNIRFRVAGTLVDLVPFGDVEEPVGEVRLPHETSMMSVFGFQEVFAAASRVTLAGGTAVRLPTPAGYAALKLKAWVDRRAHHESKDGRDLGTVMSWYEQSPQVIDRLYEPDDDDAAAAGVLEAADFDPALGAVELLARDAMSVIGASRHAELRRLWQSVDDDLLATDLAPRRALPRGPRTGRLDQRVLALRRGIDGPTPR